MSRDTWTKTRLSELITSIEAGVSVNAENRTIVDGEIGVLKTSAVVYEIFNPLEHKAIKGSERERVTVYPKSDRILICRSNTIELVGICAYVSENHESLFLPDTLWQITTNEALCSAKWLTYALNSDTMRRKIQSIAAGTSGSMKKISMTNFLKLDITLPPLTEQKRIEQIFGLCDEAIQLTGKKINAKRTQKKELLNRLLSGESRFPAHEQQPWKRIKLGDILSPRGEYGGETDELHLYSLTIENGITPKTGRYNRKFLIKQKNKLYRIVCPKDIVYNPPNLRYGAIAISKLDKPVLVSPSYEVLFVADTSKFDSEFISYAITTEDQIRRFGQKAEGTLIERMAVKLDSFLSFEIEIPLSIEEQRSIVTFLKIIDTELDLLSQKENRFKQLRLGLAQQLMTDEI